MKFDAHAAGGLDGGELDFGRSRERLSDGVQRGRDIVVAGEEICGAGSLRMERPGGDESKDQRKQSLSKRFDSESIHSYRIPNPSPSVAFRGLQKPDNLVGGSIDCPWRAEKPLHFLEPAFHLRDAGLAFF